MKIVQTRFIASLLLHIAGVRFGINSYNCTDGDRLCLLSKSLNIGAIAKHCNFTVGARHRQSFVPTAILSVPCPYDASSLAI
ncbi:hypothetical protein [Calothrix parietina]|uniref:hypothetical protein n=1 Tax=Calothrix parietina TaxID=32054 RepID=UPI0030DC0585